MSENLADRPCAVCYHMFKIEDLRDTTCIDCMEDELEALRNKVAVLEAERDELVDTLKWALTCLGYYLDFHARPDHENYKAAECCDAIHSALTKYRALDTKAQP